MANEVPVDTLQLAHPSKRSGEPQLETVTLATAAFTFSKAVCTVGGGAGVVGVELVDEDAEAGPPGDGDVAGDALQADTTSPRVTAPAAQKLLPVLMRRKLLIGAP
jgi:hypothetical protein